MTKSSRLAVRTRKLRTSVVSAALVLGMTGGLTGPASAAVTPAHSQPPAAGRATFGIKPSHASLKGPVDPRPRFEYTATPGAQQPDFVAISNNALTTLTLSVYASDAFNTDTDGFDLLPASRRPVDVGSWITLRTHSVTLKPGQSVVVPFVVNVPAKVAPGDHVGGIVTSLRTYGKDKKGDRIAIDTRVGTRVYLRIQGPLTPKLALSGVTATYHGTWWNPFSGGTVTVHYSVANHGNVRLGAHGTVDVGGSWGAVHATSIPEIGELLPDNTHQDSVVLRHVARTFHEHATLNLQPSSLPGDTDGRLADATVTVQFWAVPWMLLGLVVIVALGLVLLVLRRLRRRGATGEAARGPKRESAGVA